MGGPGSGPRPAPSAEVANLHGAQITAALAAYQAAATRLNAAMREAMADGCGAVWTAEQVGCSPSTLLKIRDREPPERWGMPMRPRGEWPDARCFRRSAPACGRCDYPVPPNRSAPTLRWTQLWSGVRRCTTRIRTFEARRRPTDSSAGLQRRSLIWSAYPSSCGSASEISLSTHAT